MGTQTPRDDFGNWNGYPDNCKKIDVSSGFCQWLIAVMLLTMAALLSSGCDDSGTNPVPVVAPSSSLQEFTIGPAGGTVEYRSTIENVTVTLDIPAAAVSADTTISIDHAQNFAATTGLVSGAVFEFGPDGLIFDLPVDLTIAYDTGMIGNLAEHDLRVHQMSGSNWVPLLGSVDTANNTVTASIDGFSVYALKTLPDTSPGGIDPGTDPGTVGDSGNPNATLTWVQDNVFGGVCSICHTGATAPMGVNWSSLADTCSNVGRVSGQKNTMNEIESGNPGASYVIWKLDGQGPNGEPIAAGTVQMPAGMTPLDAATIQNISDWIADGTLGCLTTGGGDPGPNPGTDPGTDPGVDPSAIIPTWYGVQANIFARFCTMCHAGASAPEGLSWEVDQYDTIVTNQRSSNQISTMLEVDPGSPDTSYIVWKIRGEGPNGQPIAPGTVQMPATGVPLDQALIDVVVQWISDGAPLGDPADADSGAAPPAFPVGSWMYVWNETLQVCTLCHSTSPSSTRCGVDFDCPPKDVVLTSDNYNGVVDNDEVEPFDLNGSKMWDRVTDPDPDKRMPFEMPPLNQAQLDIIRNWILDGAPFCPTGEVCP